MLAEFGCRYVIVGHSERRQLYGESDAQVAAKFAAVQAAGHDADPVRGRDAAGARAGRTEEVVARQLGAVGSFKDAVLAYEPVWAIGTGRNATPEQAQAVHAFLRKRVPARHPDPVRRQREAAECGGDFRDAGRRRRPDRRRIAGGEGFPGDREGSERVKAMNR